MRSPRSYRPVGVTLRPATREVSLPWLNMRGEANLRGSVRQLQAPSSAARAVQKYDPPGGMEGEGVGPRRGKEEKERPVKGDEPRLAQVGAEVDGPPHPPGPLVLAGEHVQLGLGRGVVAGRGPERQPHPPLVANHVE